ncbi:vWA domain-containing protein [Hyalangium rubrum]|uniref:VWA domain-containing protein n=1 Tax=Hyalangium rubrum TaxID=3103134 RepID=A0ABU5H7Q9_9BACT|nr:vWA domain-containing protein [Hyalangium sp. s54d21]MDY7229508.1 vWA domain-containing protein [Hyalangium sp. s54d21]
MLKPLALGLGLLALPTAALAEEPAAPPPATQKAIHAAASAPRVQIALLLDTSNSMDGLIDQAKRQLWTVVNTFQKARRGTQLAHLEIALYEYGKESLAQEGGYIRQIVPFTTDLDKVSEELFALKTNGGDEYAGMVIQKATRNLAWSKAAGDLKLIYIAGNEPFNQGPVTPKSAIDNAKERGIVVNTIHCGSEREGANTGWASAAQVAGGQALNIDQNRAVAHIAAPQDAELAQLGRELNKTYLGYGSKGAESKRRQEEQDTNAAGSVGSATTRAVSKASRLYDNSDWDLVDGAKKGKVKLEAVKDEELPQELRGKNAQERQAIVDAKAKERADIQGRIQKLQAEREKFVADKQQAAPAGAPATLDKAIIESASKQAAAQGLALE